MKKLTYSRNGFLRKMQLSRCNLFVFVEGIEDRYFYSEIVDREIGGKNIYYDIISGDEICDSDGGGKQSLLSFFCFLQRKKVLVDDKFGKRTVSLFFIDKDVDDFRRRMRRSSHMVYTRGYERENCVYCNGDLIGAAAAAGGLEIAAMRAKIGDPATWRRSVAEKWKEWVVLCLYAHTKLVCDDRQRFYCRPGSQVNINEVGSVDQILFDGKIDELRGRSGKEKDEFDRELSRVRCQVNEIYHKGDHDRVFKGKWYCRFVEGEARSVAGTRRYNKKAFFSRFYSVLEGSLNFEAKWAEHYRGGVRRVLAGLL